MNPNLLAAIAICAYLGSAALIFKPLARNQHKRIALGFAWLAVILHAFFIAHGVHENTGFNFSFFSMASLVSLIVSLLLLLATLGKPVENIGIFLFPLTAFMLALELFLTEKPRTITAFNWDMHIHILSSIIAYSLLNIAAVQAILLVIQNQQLRSHPPKQYIESMPPMQTMESLLFQMIAAGLAFLSVSLASGFLYMADIFAHGQRHKTIFSIFAWLIFSGLLIGRKRYGWRGQTAIKWTLLGFLFLLLAYFGSKGVREIILNR